MSVIATATTKCGRCKKGIAAKAVVATKTGPRCEKCADRLPPHLRKR